MDERPKLDRTWLCSVVFVDIVHYSMQSVELQMSWKGRLNRYLAQAIHDVPEADRVILDTGDGAAICFLGDPEPAMFCAMKLLGSLVEELPQHKEGMRARIGINLGPVKLVRDINGNLNAIGDGINVAQRVMSFAADDQILVSRSFFEVVSCLSESYSHMFRFGGIRTDKHVREHTVYELLLPGFTGRQPAAVLAAEAAEQEPAGPAPQAEPVGAAPTRQAEPAAAAPVSHLDAAVLEKIECCFAPILGPITHYLVKNASLRAATSLEVCQALMPFVPANEDPEAFLELCGAEIGSPLAAPDPDPMPVMHAPDTPAANWDPEVLERAKKDLAAYMGPVARLLVNRAAARARTADELYDLLAVEIASPKDREAFRKSLPPPHLRGR